MNKYDIIIIGAGPAGITCATYLSKTKQKVLLLEKNTPGGRMLLAEYIDNYPGFKDSGINIAMKMFENIDLNAIEFKIETVTCVSSVDDVYLVSTNNSNYYTKKLVIATGFTNKPLGLNEDEYLNKGISYCAYCDGALAKNKKILIYSKGMHDSEIEYLSNIASKIYLIGNTSIKKDNIINLSDVSIVKFLGIDALEQVELLVDGEIVLIDINYAFIFNGFIPSSNFLKELNITSKNGLIEVNENLETTLPNIYAIGDINTKAYKQVATSVGDGAFIGSKLMK